MLRNFFFYRKKERRYEFSLSPSTQKAPSAAPDGFKPVDTDISKNLEYVKRVLSLPQNGDIILREFEVSANGGAYRAFLINAEGVSRTDSINVSILRPLMELSHAKIDSKLTTLDFIYNRLLSHNQARKEPDINKLIEAVHFGNAILMVDTLDTGFLIDVKGWEHRTVGEPKNEAVVQGPHEGFNEMLRSNTALIRKTINNSNLVMENIPLGKTGKTASALCYLKNVANDGLVDEVRRRMREIDVEYLLSSLDLEQYIEEASFLSLPQTITTERPDRACRALVEGRVVIVVNGSSHVLILPATVFDLASSPEDEYLRFPYAILVRVVRIAAMFIAMLFPAVFLAVTNFHQELILSDILYAIASSRMSVPFPALVELLLMELSFELIKEAGIRVPGPIGPALGIVGGLILGQAAVSAGIVSPIMIIVVAVTGIASFAIPSYSLSFAFRFTRFLYLAVAAMAGFLGIFSLLFIQALTVLNTKSFGVPFTSPVAPRGKEGIMRLLFTAPVWKGDTRPSYLDQKDREERGKWSRKWMKK